MTAVTIESDGLTIETTTEAIENTARQLRLPTFEGQSITEQRLSFSGAIDLEDDEPLAKALRLNAEVELVVTGRVVSRKHQIKRDKDGYIEGVISGAAVLVESVALAE